MAFLRAWHVDRPDEVQEQELSSPQLTIGRGVDNDVQLDVAGASRQHAMVTLEREAVWVVDRGSTNGTWVAGQRVERARLEPGDRFQIGGMVFELASSSLVRPTVVEDWRGLQAPPAAGGPGMRLRREGVVPPASVTLVETSSGRPLQPAREIPARGLAFGRDPSNDLCLEDGEVSRFHARVTPREETYMLEDLGSRNGTWVNRMRVRQHCLAHADCFRIGHFSFIFHAPGQPEPTPFDALDTPVPGRPTTTPVPAGPVPPTGPATAVNLLAPAEATTDEPSCRCPACQAPMLPDDRFCGSCGAPRADTTG